MQKNLRPIALLLIALVSLSACTVSADLNGGPSDALETEDEQSESDDSAGDNSEGDDSNELGSDPTTTTAPSTTTTTEDAPTTTSAAPSTTAPTTTTAPPAVNQDSGNRKANSETGFVRSILIDETQTHSPSDAVVTLDQIGFRDNGTNGARFTVINSENGRIALNGVNSESYLLDDLGNTYEMAKFDDNLLLNLMRGESKGFQVAFNNRIDPNAKTVTLVTNDPDDPTDERAVAVEIQLTFGPYAIADAVDVTEAGPDAPTDEDWQEVAQDAGFDTTLRINETELHPASVLMRLDQIGFRPDGSAAARFAVQNGDKVQVAMDGVNSENYLLDDLGNTYEMTKIEENRLLNLKRESNFTVRVAFEGRIDPKATTLTLVINDGDDPRNDQVDAREPSFTFGPYKIADAVEVSPGT